MVAVPGFDDQLVAALDRVAASLGESADSYVQRAVVARLIADLTSRDESDDHKLLQHLAELGLNDAQRINSPLQAVVTDPARLRALEATGLLDSPPDAAYDRIVAMAAEALTAPGAAVSLIDRDRQFFKSSRGLDETIAEARETPLDMSVCQFAVASGKALVVEDARLDPMLMEHPAVVGGSVIAYAGIPLLDDAEHAIGTFCVWDDKPRQWSTGHVHILTDLAGMVRELIYGRDNDLDFIKP